MPQTSLDLQPDGISHLSHLMITSPDSDCLAPIRTANDACSPRATPAEPSRQKSRRKEPKRLSQGRNTIIPPEPIVRQNPVQADPEPVRFSRGGLVIIPRVSVVDLGHNHMKTVFKPKGLSELTTCLLDGCPAALRTRIDHWVVDYSAFKYHFDQKHSAGTIVECSEGIDKTLWKCPHRGCSVVVDKPSNLSLHLFTFHMSCKKPEHLILIE